MRAGKKDTLELVCFPLKKTKSFWPSFHGNHPPLAANLHSIFNRGELGLEI